MRKTSIGIGLSISIFLLSSALLAEEASVEKTGFDGGNTAESRSSPVQSSGSGAWFVKGYGVASALLGIHTWGWWEIDEQENGEEIAHGELEGGFSGGAGVAGYYSLRSGVFHIGGGVAYTSGGWRRTQEDFEEKTTLKQFSFGVTLKLGNRVGKRLWLGGALDFGPIVHLTEKWEGNGDLATENTSDADLGVRLFPYLAADIMLINTEGFKFGLAIAAGAVFVPAISDIESSLSEVELSQRYLTPMINIGLMLGG